MARRLPTRVLRHLATPRDAVEDAAAAEWAEGEPGDAPEPVVGEPFRCILFLPLEGESTAEEQTWRPSRTVRRPTVLWNLRDVRDRPPRQGGELLVDVQLDVEMERLLGARVTRWIVEGDAQPYGPPGRVFGGQVTLRRVGSGS